MIPKYCVECGAPLAKITETKYTCANGHGFYNNPAAACSIIFLNDRNELLYAKRGHEPAKGKYDLPGGFLDYNEDAYAAAVREVKEETSLDITANDLELIDSSTHSYLPGRSSCDAMFLCRTWQGNPTPADDVVALEWRPLEFLRSESFAWQYLRLYDKLQKVLNQSS